MKSAGTTAPQCCELYFNYFTVLLTGCSSKQPGFTIVGFKRAHDCEYRQKERLFHEERKWRSIKAGHQNEMKLYYLSIIDNNILINAARTNATINHMTFITGAGMLLILESVFFILILLSKPVVYKGNINTVT